MAEEDLTQLVAQLLEQVEQAFVLSRSILYCVERLEDAAHPGTGRDWNQLQERMSSVPMPPDLRDVPPGEYRRVAMEWVQEARSFLEESGYTQRPAPRSERERQCREIEALLKQVGTQVLILRG